MPGPLDEETKKKTRDERRRGRRLRATSAPFKTGISFVAASGIRGGGFYAV